MTVETALMRAGRGLLPVPLTRKSTLIVPQLTRRELDAVGARFDAASQTDRGLKFSEFKLDRRLRGPNSTPVYCTVRPEDSPSGLKLPTVFRESVYAQLFAWFPLGGGILFVAIAIAVTDPPLLYLFGALGLFMATVGLLAALSRVRLFDGGVTITEAFLTARLRESTGISS
jgi:hypothetical protein